MPLLLPLLIFFLLAALRQVPRFLAAEAQVQQTAQPLQLVRSVLPLMQPVLMSLVSQAWLALLAKLVLQEQKMLLVLLEPLV
jgi:ABC-type sugar transport system permease subunit